jgi:hypothetical protein
MIMTHITSKLIRSSHIVVLSAGVLLQAYSALASEPIGDAQAQARALLNRPVASHVTSVEASTSMQTSDHVAPRADAQEFARALLSGKSIDGNATHSSIARYYAGEGTQPSSAQGRRVYSTDAQEAARRMILGIGEPALTSTHLAVSER